MTIPDSGNSLAQLESKQPTGILRNCDDPMKSAIVLIVLCSATAFATGVWLYRDKPATVPDTGLSANTFDQALPMESRIAALEQAVSDERQARQLLQEEVFYLTGELEMMMEDDFVAADAPVVVEESGRDSRSSRREEYRRRNSVEGRVERLIEAGFQPSQAAQIVRREAELQMESLQARYDAERSGEEVDWWRDRSSTSSTLRAELGDTDYERYLVANNRSTSVSISSVIESSPAHAAGLLAGDEIVRYGGERVFSMTELTQQTMQGIPGENVAVDIVRNGITMQIVMPRGPFGISGGRRSR